jgi:hypothetical protein
MGTDENKGWKIEGGGWAKAKAEWWEETFNVQHSTPNIEGTVDGYG